MSNVRAQEITFGSERSRNQIHKYYRTSRNRTKVEHRNQISHRWSQCLINKSYRYTLDNKRDKTVGGGLCLCLFGWELIFGNYLKLFIDELFGWPSTALNKQKMKENQKLINEQNTQSNSEEKWCKVKHLSCD